MKHRATYRWLGGVVALVLLGLVGWGLWLATRPDAAVAQAGQGPRGGERAPVPVEVAPVRVGPIALRRQFTGSLESEGRVSVAPNIGGRVVSLPVRLGDRVELGDVLVRLDDAEHAQAVAQAEAELAVAEAELAQARSSAEIAERAWQRATTLAERGVTSESALDTATAERLASTSAVQVALAQVQQARAALGLARVRLEYATIKAQWSEGGPARVVSEVAVDVGDTVAANTPLLTLVSLDPIRAVIYVTEADYAEIDPGKEVAVSTDAYPAQTFRGVVSRVAPAFVASSRQARIEVLVENPDGHLKPGMFVRASTTLRSIADALSVPEEALARRDEQTVVFVVAEDGRTVTMQPITVGVRDEGWVQVAEPALSGRVVTLGQQLLGDGSTVKVVNAASGGASAPAAAPATSEGRR